MSSSATSAVAPPPAIASSARSAAPGREFERELRQRRSRVERTVKQNRRRFEREVRSVRRDLEKQSGVVGARVEKLVAEAQELLNPRLVAKTSPAGRPGERGKRERFAGLISSPANAAPSPPSTAGASRKWRPVGLKGAVLGRTTPTPGRDVVPRRPRRHAGTRTSSAARFVSVHKGKRSRTSTEVRPAAGGVDHVERRRRPASSVAKSSPCRAQDA